MLVFVKKNKRNTKLYKIFQQRNIYNRKIKKF